ncbi:adenosylcobinamide-GDP ribazoletransferase [Azotosporobacter soli]|uniref:adenosylcobinamide-GDP ribazoletransferase n=1 Tax=Azotosporobacter soli TaxID=3055040 RepID=UPI0031FEBF7A
MNDFITGLQFLTRIKIAEQQVWSAESFGRSVKYFSFVGASLGALLWLLAMALTFLPERLGFLPAPQSVSSLVLLMAAVFLTGGLTCDGFMDSMDGLFSGRERERMLEIMKDSRVGANGVTAFVFLVLAKWSALQGMLPVQVGAAIWAMPIIGRMAMVIAITCFPYARPDGIGKAFAEHAGTGTLLLAMLSGGFFLALGGWKICVAGLAAICMALLFAHWASKQLEGLTGDLYGACCEISEVCLLMMVLLLG